MTSISRSHMATTTCTIRRPLLSTETGSTTWPADHLTDVPCTPLMPRSTGLYNAGRPQGEMMADTIQHEVYVFDSYDIKKGDVLVLDGVEYAIWDKHLWGTSDPFTVLVLSDVQAPATVAAEFVR